MLGLGLGVGELDVQPGLEGFEEHPRNSEGAAALTSTLKHQNAEDLLIWTVPVWG
jgi:hypothetical protein